MPPQRTFLKTAPADLHHLHAGGTLVPSVGLATRRYARGARVVQPSKEGGSPILSGQIPRAIGRPGLEKTRCPGWTPGPAPQTFGFQRLPLSASPATTTPKSSSHSTPFQGLELRKAEECPIRTDRGPRAPNETIGWPKAVELPTTQT